MMNQNLRALFLLFVIIAAISATVAQAQPTPISTTSTAPATVAAPPYPGVLAQRRDGDLYGTQVSGSANGRGTIFKMTPGGVITSLHDFNVSDGHAPQGGVTLALDGDLYGTTAGGGANSKGLEESQSKWVNLNGSRRTNGLANRISGSGVSLPLRQLTHRFALISRRWRLGQSASLCISLTHERRIFFCQVQ